MVLIVLGWDEESPRPARPPAPPRPSHPPHRLHCVHRVRTVIQITSRPVCPKRSPKSFVALAHSSRNLYIAQYHNLAVAKSSIFDNFDTDYHGLSIEHEANIPILAHIAFLPP